MSLDKLHQLVGSFVQKVDDNEKFATSVLAVKVAKYLEKDPQDQTLGAFSRILEKMASNQKLFITKGELKSLYNKLYTSNTKFAELFSNELGIKEYQPEVKVGESYKQKELNIFECADPVLANALNSVFDKTKLKMYSDKLAKSAVEMVGSNLESLNLKPVSLEVAEGNEKFLVLQANYETPKGITSFYVPVEIVNNKVVEASIFLGNATPQELTHQNIKKYIQACAGNKLIVNAGAVLDILVKSSAQNKEITDTEMAIIKLNNSRRVQAEFSSNQIIGQKMEAEGIKDVELPKLKTFASFEEEFDSVIGKAQWKFGSLVTTAMTHIARELTGFGYRNPQISVSKVDDNTIFYSVALDAGKVAFTIPVKVANKNIIKPEVFICNGSLNSLNRESINKLYVENQIDYKAAAAASPQFGLKPSDLIDNIRSAVEEGNHAKAEDALNVLRTAGDARAYETGFRLYKSALTGKKVSVESKCDMQIKNASSIHTLCGHTGLPLHKVYQDKHGKCCPEYRRDMQETYEAASFINHKIFG